MTLDDFDARILAVLQDNSALTAEGIGERVGLSGSAVTKRLKKLHASGLIERQVAVLNLRMSGPPITALVVCAFDPDGPAVRDAFSALALSRPEVTNVWELTGEVDMAFTLVARSLEECMRAIRSLQESCPALRTVKEHIVTAQPKRSLAVPFSLAGLRLAQARSGNRVGAATLPRG